MSFNVIIASLIMVSIPFFDCYFNLYTNVGIRFLSSFPIE